MEETSFLTEGERRTHPLPDLYLVEGGPFFRLSVALRLKGFLRPAVALALFAWLPLLILSAMDGTLAGRVEVPFLHSVGTHVRFLIAIPLLFFAEWRSSSEVRKAVRHLFEIGLVSPDDMEEFRGTVRSTLRWRDSVIPEAIIAAAVIALAISGSGANPIAGLSSWRTGVSGSDLSPAGWWAAAVSLPLFQFLICRWCWRILLWWRFLWRFSKLDLRLVPTHPDSAGGLGYLGTVQRHYQWLCLAMSVVLAGNFAERILFGSTRFESLIPHIVVLALVTQVLFVGPPLIFMPRLAALKRLGLREYGALGMRYASDFEAKWLRPNGVAEEPILGTGDIQSLTDLAGSFEIITGMRSVPFRRELPLSILIASIAPMLLLLPLAYPDKNVLLEGLRMIVGV